ncbi:MAG: hypothetical protein MUF47_08780 [Porphyrobacter sp.]|nr:hypothetical protein [Porphyrobacter sp.]
MCLRISSALGLIAMLAACKSESPPPPGDVVECAIGGRGEFAPVCTLERVGQHLVLHHPDGGFRRLTGDLAAGTLAPGDGADPLVIDQSGPGNVQLSIAGERYRLARSMLGAPS